MSVVHTIVVRIKHTAEVLPHEKQQQIFDFAEYLKKKNKAVQSDGSSLLKIVGTLEGPADMAANHDEIYDK